MSPTLNSSAKSGNYVVSRTTNGSLSIVGYAQSACFMPPLYSVMPSTKSYQKKGSVLPIKCTLLTNTGAVVENAAGSLTITDVTAGGVTRTIPTNAFKFTGSLYMNQIDTSEGFYVVGHYYTVVAKWNDGVSSTTGYFYVALR